MRTLKSLPLLVAAALLLTSNLSFAQTLTTGDVTGTLTDSSGAVIPDATVTLRSLDTGATRTVTSNNEGMYRFNLISPGRYELSATSSGLRSDIGRVVVGVGQVTAANLTLKVEESKQVILVTEAAPVLQTDNANLTTSYSAVQMNALPLPGGDITSVALTAPGITVSTGAGYGNFSSHGLPGISNLFTVNGVDEMDPFLNLNNSGASNLTLGQNEIQEVSVVQNGYSGQYGRQAGANVNFITKSGSNTFHGKLLYTYNGSFLNANDFFNNESGTPRGRAISNQYGADLGGPIKKDKLFFYVNTEGLRYTLPTADTVVIPSPALESYILAHVSSAQVPFYQKAFSFYNSTPGISRAVPVTTGPGDLQDSSGALGCGGLAGTATTGGTFGTNVGCALAFGASVSNQNTEWLFSGRADYNISDRHKIYFRFKTDHGLQPTDTSDINPLFNAISNQPSYEGSLNEQWVISPRMVNQFLGSATYYSAIFAPADLSASLAAFPSRLNFNDGGTNTAVFTSLGVNNSSFPQGRRVGQLQIVDDLSYTVGKHSLKFGVNYRYNRVTDTGNQTLTAGGTYTFNTLNEFASGVIDPTSGSSYAQRFSSVPVVHIRLYNVGFYAQDEWSVTSSLKLTLALRIDRNGNPDCVDSCYARLNSPFESLQHGASIPYNQSITTGISSAFPNIEAAVVQPRIGFAWSPGRFKHTVVRGGFGVFADQFPAFFIGSLYAQAPLVFTPSVRAGTVNSGGTGSSPALALATANAFQSGFAGGATLAQLQATLAQTNVTFTPPPYFSVANDMKASKYLEWNFEVEQQFGGKNVVSAGYVGNHGYDIFNRNLKANASASATAFPNGFEGLTSTPPDPRFRIITTLDNSGYSNYDGLTVQYRRAMGYGLQGQLSYTWSHALDTVSNGGLSLFFIGASSLTSQNDPFNKHLNYSNSDYDTRHQIAADFVWAIPFHGSHAVLKNALGGWTLGSKVFYHTGFPFSVINSSLPGRLSPSTGGNVLASLTNLSSNRVCGPSAVDTPCLLASSFATTTTQTNFGNIPRNFFRAPGYVDTDATIYKDFALGTERAHMMVGMQVYNLFNHPNFGPPGINAAVPQQLGVLNSTVTAPTSPYGSFQGSAVSGRVVALTGRFTF